MNPHRFDKFQIDTSNGPPRILFVGEEQNAQLLKTLFVREENALTRSRSPRFVSYGFGQNPVLYDHWVAGHAKDRNFTRDFSICDENGHPYGFDMVVLHLDNWMQPRPDEERLSTSIAPYEILSWCTDFLPAGGLLVVTGTDKHLEELMGSLAYRLSSVYCMSTGPNSAQVAVFGCKKDKPVRDDLTRACIEAFLEKLDPRDFGWGYDQCRRLQYLSPDPEAFRVVRRNEEGPRMFTREQNHHFTARALVNSDIPHPFEDLRPHYVVASAERSVVMPMMPPQGHLAKMICLVNGLIQDDDGYLHVIKGSPETVKILTKNGELSELQRQQLYFIQLNGPDEKSVSNPETDPYKGRISVIQVG